MNKKCKRPQQIVKMKFELLMSSYGNMCEKALLYENQ